MATIRNKYGWKWKINPQIVRDVWAESFVCFFQWNIFQISLYLYLYFQISWYWDVMMMVTMIMENHQFWWYWHNKSDDVNVDDDVDGDRGCCDDTGVDNDDDDGDDGDNDIGYGSGDDAIGITRCGVSILPLEPSARSNNGCICLNSLTHSFIHTIMMMMMMDTVMMRSKRITIQTITTHS